MVFGGTKAFRVCYVAYGSCLAILGYQTHFAALLISAATGPTSVTREHLGVAVALNITVFVIITKIDSVTSSALEKFAFLFLREILLDLLVFFFAFYFKHFDEETLELLSLFCLFV